MSYGPSEKEINQLIVGSVIGLVGLGILLATVTPLIWNSVKPVLLALLQ